jgi:hypothetical protein
MGGISINPEVVSTIMFLLSPPEHPRSAAPESSAEINQGMDQTNERSVQAMVGGNGSAHSVFVAGLLPQLRYSEST